MSSDAYNPADRYGIKESRSSFQVVLRRQGRIWSSTFSFAVWGGREAALQQARIWRDDIVRRYPPRSRRAKAQQLICSNTSGVAGVTAKRTPEGRVWLWSAKTVVGPGQTLNKSFSVGRYGEDARRMAIAERQRQLRQLPGRAYVHPAEAVVRTAPPARPGPVGKPRHRDELPRRNNTSGVPGVHRVQGDAPHPGWWVAVTARHGQRLRKSFSIKVHGDEQARALAMAERDRQLRQLRRQAPPSQGGSPPSRG